MDGAPAAGYWCHVCARIVNPVMDADIKCPRCDGGFIEEMEGQAESNSTAAAAAADLDSDRDIPVWAPILLGMLGDGLRRRSSRSSGSRRGGGDSDDSSEQESERRGRQSGILEVINDLQERERDRGRERVIVINPFSQAVIIRAAGGEGQGLGGADLGDYFVGQGLEQLLQHLAEGDPSRRGTPPANREAVEAMPTVRVVERASCYVCLEELEIGEEAREMPCKHRFHGGCILPWLEAHSTCPVCRHQLPVEGPKEDATVGDGGSGENGGNGRRFRMPVPWPFSGLFSSSGASQNNANGHGDGNGSSNSRSDES